jgi:transposase
MSNPKGAPALLSTLPSAKMLLGDKGYDADWFRTALAERGAEACIPARRRRKLQDWRRIGIRYDRCGELFLSAIRIAATVIFWL